MSLVPVKKPLLALEKLDQMLLEKGVTEAVKLVAVRGFQGPNVRRSYDDAMFLIAPGFFASYNCNTDPNGRRPGHGYSSEKGMATLKEGVWRAWKIGKHKGLYTALVQTAGKVTVYRDADAQVPKSEIVLLDGQKAYLHTGSFGINIHHGGAGSTSSIGCQTIPPGEQWDNFIKNVQYLMNRHGQTVMPYLLTRLPE